MNDVLYRATGNILHVVHATGDMFAVIRTSAIGNRRRVQMTASNPGAVLSLRDAPFIPASSDFARGQRPQPRLRFDSATVATAHRLWANLGFGHWSTFDWGRALLEMT